MKLNKKQTKTLGLIFERPTRANIKWTDVATLFNACGAKIVQGQGSRVGVKLGDERAVFHTPHPQKEVVKGAVEDIRSFLQRAGIHP